MGTTCQLRLSHHPYDSVRRYRWGRGISSGLKYIADTVADGTGWTEMELKSSEYFREGSFKMKRGNSLRNTEQWRETKTYPHHLSPDIRRCSMNRNDCKYFGICITATTDLSWYPGTSPDIQPPLPCTLCSPKGEEISLVICLSAKHRWNGDLTRICQSQDWRRVKKLNF